MVILGRLLSAMLKIRRINWYTHDQICRGKNSINDIFPLTIMNVKSVTEIMILIRAMINTRASMLKTIWGLDLNLACVRLALFIKDTVFYKSYFQVRRCGRLMMYVQQKKTKKKPVSIWPECWIG